MSTYHPANRTKVRPSVSFRVLFLNDSRHAEVTDLWLLIVRQLSDTRVNTALVRISATRVTYQNVSRSKVAVHNVVVVKVKQSVGNLHRVLTLFFHTKHGA
jgi:hypothetical protein